MPHNILDTAISIAGGAASVVTCLTFIYLVIIQRKRDNTQQFESSLFNLLSLHNQIISNLNYEKSTGRLVFSDAKMVSSGMLDANHSFIKDGVSTLRMVKTKADAKHVLRQSYYLNYYSSFESQLNHYFRNLYHIFLYIDSSSLLPTWNPFQLNHRKYAYARIVRAQLSQDELFVIMLNSIIQDYGYPKFLNLIKKYNVMKNFRVTDVKPKVFYQLFEDMINKNSNESSMEGIVVEGM